MNREEFIKGVEELVGVPHKLSDDGVTVEVEIDRFCVRLFGDDSVYITTPEGTGSLEAGEKLQTVLNIARTYYEEALKTYVELQEYLYRAVAHCKTRIKVPVHYHETHDSQMPCMDIMLGDTSIRVARIAVDSCGRNYVTIGGEFSDYEEGFDPNVETWLLGKPVDKEIYVLEVAKGRIIEELRLVGQLLRHEQTKFHVRTLELVKSCPNGIPKLPFYQKLFEKEYKTFVEFFVD